MPENHLKDMDYPTYLGLDKILDAQHLVSAQDPKRDGQPAHDEMLFVVVHQAYELWFKLVLFELSRVQDIFSGETIKDRELRPVVSSLERIVETLKLLVQQLDVLETMTPLDFLEFRHVFRTASGFQSAQFRELEIRLGLKREDRLSYDGHSYDRSMSDEQRAHLKTWEETPSLFEQIETWLSRTPFVDMGDYNFWDTYRDAVYTMLEEDRENSLEEDLEKIDRTQQRFDELFESEEPEGWRFSGKALQAALFINMYRDQPVLHQPYRILHLTMDIDQLLTVWRYRHALMVQRMIGMKTGSGGSAGHAYLTQTAEKHRVFSDLFSLTTFLIPRSARPALPKDIQEQMEFSYA